MASLFVALRRFQSLASPLCRASFTLRHASSRCIIDSDDDSIPLSDRKRIVTGVNPLLSVDIHQYLSHIKTIIALQDICDTFFSLATYRLFKPPRDAERFRKAIIQTAATYLACGIDAHKVCMFHQNLTSSFAEFAYILLRMAPEKWLKKIRNCHVIGADNVSPYIYTHPIFLATELLIYKSNFILSGDHEKEHAQFMHLLAKRVNRLCGMRCKEVGGSGGAIFKVPKILKSPYGPQVMFTIDILDEKDVIAKKLSEYNECSGRDILLSLYKKVVLGKTKEEVEMECENMDLEVLKLLLTDALIEHLHPIQIRYKELISDPSYLEDLLRRGDVVAEEIANETLMNLRRAVGLNTNMSLLCGS